MVTCVRGDGREVSLKDFTLAELFRSGETVRAEEIALRVPDGRSVNVLLNATPIHGEDGEVTSFVVTLQDMTPLEEQERLRAEFLAMVSHELRAPLTSIKGSVTTLLEAAGELDSVEMTQFHRIIRDQSDQMRYLIGDLLDVARIESGDLPVDPEPTDLGLLMDEAGARFRSGDASNPLETVLDEDLPLVMADRRRIVQVLSNLLANAASYSPEGSPIVLSAERDGVYVAVSVAGRGQGLFRGDASGAFPQVLQGVRRGDNIRHRRVGSGSCRLQGDSGDPRWPYQCRERGSGTRRALHLHAADGRDRILFSL